jgi:hypothetical protein
MLRPLVPAEATSRMGMTDLIPAFAAMSDAAVLDGSRVAGSALAGQTQSRERNHARVSFRFFYS